MDIRQLILLNYFLVLFSGIAFILSKSNIMLSLFIASVIFALILKKPKGKSINIGVNS